MHGPVTYSADHANGTVELTLTDGRFVAKSQGRGLLDKPRLIDIALTDLDKFCVVPTIAAQNIVDATGTNLEYDRSYDAEFIFSYRDNGTVKKKRIFVDRRDEAWQRFIGELKNDCPAASLLDLDPAEAQKQIGAMSGTRALSLVFGIIIGVPLIVGLIVLLSRMHH
jgi:hypothetical protein